MKVIDVYYPSVVWVSVDEPLMTAVVRMRDYEVGALPVMENGSMVGIVTEHDVLRAGAEAARLGERRVRDFMTPDPVTVRLSDHVTDAAALMSARRLRHLPVVEHDRPIGMVSARDLLSILADRRMRVSLRALDRERRDARGSCTGRAPPGS